MDPNDQKMAFDLTIAEPIGHPRVAWASTGAEIL